MTFIQKTTYFIFVAIICLLIVTNSNLIFADNMYPLEPGEKLVEERAIDKTHIEIFTMKNNNYFLKKLEKKENQWAITASEILKPRKTGLEISKSKGKGDKGLDKAIRSELRKYGVEATALPSIKDYSQSEFLPPVGEQYEYSCVGWAAGYYLRTYQQAKDYGWKVKESGIGESRHIFSPSFIYNQLNNGQDRGTSIDAAAELLRNTGGATMDKFPYIPGDYLTQPSEDVIQSAYPHRIREWKRLYTDDDTDDYIIQKTKEYLNTGDLVVAGSRVGVKFEKPYEDNNGNSIITQDFSFLGNHAYLIVGYNDRFQTLDGKGAFKLVNSWGKDWGDDGFCYISYTAFANYAMEGYVFTDLVNRIQKELEVDVNDAVDFNMNFSGAGRYDIKINNANGGLAFREDNLQGKPGLNTYTWNGKDQEGNITADGNYRLSVIPYKDNAPKEPFDIDFAKSGKLKHASSSAVIDDGAIKCVVVFLDTKSQGELSIKIIYNGAVYDIVSEKNVEAEKPLIYFIENSQFDFNGKDLNKINIKVDIH